MYFHTCFPIYIHCYAFLCIFICAFLLQFLETTISIYVHQTIQEKVDPPPHPPIAPPLIFPYFSLDFFIKFFASFFTFKCYGAAVLFLLYILAILLFLLYILAIVGKIVVFSRDIQSNSSDPTFKFDCSKLQTILFTTNLTSVHQFNNICCCVGYIIGHHHAESSCRN